MEGFPPESRDDAGARGDGDELELHAPHPAHGRQLVLEQEVVCLVVEAPLADHLCRSQKKKINMLPMEVPGR